MKKQTRLEKISRRRSERNLLFIITGIVILGLILFFYGVPLFINFISLVGNLKDTNETQVTPISSYVAPPIIDTLFDATNSAEINVSGSALPQHTVKLYVNGKYAGQEIANDDKSFEFKKIKLEIGNNTIKSKAINASEKESAYSQDLHITYLNKAPDLTIKSPQDKQVITGDSNQIKIEGVTTPGAHITVNDYWAIVNEEGNFSYLLQLQKGENKIKVVATNEAENQTSKEITVSLNQ